MTTIRGAITIENNERSEIVEGTSRLLKDIFDKNGLNIEDIVYILFTATKDLDSAYPAIAAREMGIVEASLMCMQEMHVEGSLPMCVRVMAAVNSDKKQSEMVHCYLESAKNLRPDLVKKYSVAIDGPSASGKSSVAKEAAKRLGFIYIDTGAMYRAVAYHCMRKGISSTEGIIGELDKFQLDVKLDSEGQKTYLDGEDVTETIRTEETGNAASVVATIPEVRRKLVELQRELAKGSSVIMDGRDIGTVVLPDADVKIYVTASIDERTKRRCIDIEKKGIPSNFEAVKKQINERDINDSGREDSPLVKADGAKEIDTTHLTFEESVDAVITLINEKMQAS